MDSKVNGAQLAGSQALAVVLTDPGSTVYKGSDDLRALFLPAIPGPRGVRPSIERDHQGLPVDRDAVIHALFRPEAKLG